MATLLKPSISAADANRNFSKLLGRAKAGETVTITVRGKPVAQLAPVDSSMDDEAEAERQAAVRKLVDRLRSQPFRVIGPWTRDELYDRD